MRMAGYCRVSTSAKEQLESLENQKAYFSELAIAHNHTLVEIYPDKAKRGGSVKKRLAFQRMMSDARKGHFDLLIIKDFSRFARNTVDFLVNFRELKELNIKVFAASAGQDLTTMDEFTVTIFAASAQQESSSLSARVKFGKLRSAKMGRVPKSVFGYNHIDNFKLEIKETEAAVVIRMFYLYVVEGLGSRTVARVLNSETALRTRSQRPWNEKAVIRILRNDLYNGILYPQKREVVNYLTQKARDIPKPERIPPMDKPEYRIVDKEIFKKAQRILEQRGNEQRENTNRYSNVHPWSSMIRCKQCGKSFRHISPRGIGLSPKWACNGRKLNGKDYCQNSVNISQDELNTELTNYFTLLTKNQSNFIADVVSEFNLLCKQLPDQPDDIKVFEAKLKKMEDYKTNLFSLLRDKVISVDDFKIQSEKTLKEAESLQKRLQQLNGKETRKEYLDKALKRTVQNIGPSLDVNQWSNADIRRVIDHLEVFPDGRISVFLKLLEPLGQDDEIKIQTRFIGKEKSTSDDATDSANNTEKMLLVVGGNDFTPSAHVVPSDMCGGWQRSKMYEKESPRRECAEGERLLKKAVKLF